jgi:hypothetical protein|tara:strand:+ start:106 stop:237 length:132 start_codon:yes stop_codon:yes gene_type:complete
MMVIDDIAFTFIVFNNVIYCACKIQPSIFFTTKAQKKKKEEVF